MEGQHPEAQPAVGLLELALMPQANIDLVRFIPDMAKTARDWQGLKQYVDGFLGNDPDGHIGLQYSLIQLQVSVMAHDDPLAAREVYTEKILPFRGLQPSPLLPEDLNARIKLLGSVLQFRENPQGKRYSEAEIQKLESDHENLRNDRNEIPDYLRLYVPDAMSSDDQIYKDDFLSPFFYVYGPPEAKKYRCLSCQWDKCGGKPSDGKSHFLMDNRKCKKCRRMTPDLVQRTAEYFNDVGTSSSRSRSGQSGSNRSTGLPSSRTHGSLDVPEGSKRQRVLDPVGEESISAILASVPGIFREIKLLHDDQAVRDACENQMTNVLSLMEQYHLPPHSPWVHMKSAQSICTFCVNELYPLLEQNRTAREKLSQVMLTLSKFVSKLMRGEDEDEGAAVTNLALTL